MRTDKGKVLKSRMLGVQTAHRRRRGFGRLRRLRAKCHRRRFDKSSGNHEKGTESATAVVVKTQRGIKRKQVRTDKGKVLKSRMLGVQRAQIEEVLCSEGGHCSTTRGKHEGDVSASGRKRQSARQSRHSR